MPLTRYQIRNEYSLADPELYKAADRDDPEARLEGVAMAGLIGVLRQLGDLAEFAAEIFHDLHEEVMSTAARGHGLMVRVQQLEAEFPSIEKAFLSQTNHSTFFSNAGVDWHPNMQMKQNLITGGDLPRCVMDSYEECRGPPRLFLLDKFDVAGAGACLKRYTDPSLFKVEVAPSGIPSMEVQREKRMRKLKKKGSRWRNGETPETLPTSHAKLHELFLEETIEKNYANPARLVKLKKRQLNASPFDPRSGKSYMEKFLESPTENNVVREISVTPLALKLASDNSSESGPEIHDISTVSPVKKSSQGKESTRPNPRELVLNSSIDESYKEVIDGRIMDAPGLLAHGETDETSSHNVTVEKDIAVDGKGQADRCLERDRSDDMTSEVDNYVDALTSVESEMETDNECRSRTGHGYLSVGRRGEDSTRNEEHMDSQVNSWDSRSIGNFSASDDGSSSFKKERSSFSYSDSPSNLVENTHSDGERASAHVVPSETSMSEIAEMPSNQLPANMQILRTNPHDLELLNNGCVDEDNSHGLAEESSNYRAKDSSLLWSDPAASLELHRVDEMLHQHTYNEKHSVCTISGFELANINEDATDLADSSTVTDMALLRTKDDALSTACAGHFVDRSDGEHPDVTSDTLLNNLNNLELAPEKKNCDDSVGEELHSDFAGEKCMENMVHDRTRNIDSSLSTSTAAEEQYINSSLSTSTATEEQSHFSATSESETHVDVRSLPDSTDVMNSDKSVSHLDGASRLTGIYVKNLMPLDDASETLKGELLSDAAENLPPVELDSTEKEVGYSMGDVNPDTTGTADCVGLESTEKPLPCLEEVADLEDGEKISFLTCKVDKAEEDDVPLELPSSSPACSALEDNVGIDHVVAVSVHTEKTVVSATTAATASLMTAGTGDEDYTDVICQAPTLIGSQSGNLVKMPESSVMENQHQEEPEVSEPFLSESFRASEETEKDQLKVVPSVLPSTSFKLVSNEDSNVEMVDGTQESSVAHTTEIYLHAGDINIASASSELEATSSPTAHHLPDPETSSEQLLELQASQSGIEDLKTDQANSKWSDDLYHIAPQRCYDDASESYRGISSEVLPSEVLELQGDQSGMQNLKTDHANSKPSDDLYHIAQERCYSDASESYGGFSRQLLPSQHLKPLTLEQFNSTGQALSPASSVLPSIDMFHEAPQVSLEEMPPLPPLPPMQWRLGKIQPAPPVSEKEFIKQSQEPIPSTSPLKHDEQTQFGYPDPQRGIEQPGNSFLQVAAAEVEKSEKESETVVGNIMQHNVFSSQLPTDANSEQKNPSLESLELSVEKPDHGFSALVPSSSNPFLPAATHIEYYNLKDDTISLQGSEVQPPSKITLETGLVGKVLENTSQSLEQEQGNTFDPSVSPTKEVEEQSQHGLLTSEEEPAWTSNPFVLLPTSEAGMTNGSSKTKIPRPRNPLIDAVAAHDKSKLRKVTERVLPQSEPKVDERDSLLEQIRTKSFNLKPAVVSRPSMPGPTPNLKLAAILEKANAIRHATAGSDEDSDSWSDS